MFLNSHQLQCIVSGLFDPGKYVVTKFSIASNLGVFLGHSNVHFIYKKRCRRFGKLFTFPKIRFFRPPHLGIEYQCFRILHDAIGIGGNTIPLPACPMNFKTIKIPVRQGGTWQTDLPNPIGINLFQCKIRFCLPIRHGADQKNLSSIGRPFPKNPLPFLIMHAKIPMAGGKIWQCQLPGRYLGFLALDSLQPMTDNCLVWL